MAATDTVLTEEHRGRDRAISQILLPELTISGSVMQSTQVVLLPLIRQL